MFYMYTLYISRRAIAQRCPSPPMLNLISVGGQHQGRIETILCYRSVLQSARRSKNFLMNFSCRMYAEDICFGIYLQLCFQKKKYQSEKKLDHLLAGIDFL